MKNLFKFTDCKSGVVITLDYLETDLVYVYHFVDNHDDSKSKAESFSSFDSAYCRFLLSCLSWLHNCSTERVSRETHPQRESGYKVNINI